MRAESAAGNPLRAACQAVGLDPTDSRLIHDHATSVHVLPRSGVVVRITSARTTSAAVRRALATTSRLDSADFPVTVPAPGVDQPIAVEGGRVASFWTYVPNSEGQAAPGTAELGRLLRRLHDLPSPLLDLPPYVPLRDFRGAVSETRSLTEDDRMWLLDESSALLAAYSTLKSPLGTGHVHGDAYPGNIIGPAESPVLGDWEETACGPRELDLANTYQGVRFGRTDADLAAFATEYGYDAREWSGLTTLIAMRDLHTLGSYIRRAEAGDVDAARELHLRVESIRRGDRLARWTTA